MSAVDIRLMALAYQLTKEQLHPEVFASLLKLEPENAKTQTVMGSGITKSDEHKSQLNKVEIDTAADSSTSTVDNPAETHEEKDADDDGDEVEGEDDDGGEWITPNNYKSKLKEMEGVMDSEDELNQIPVACLTTDFAMQVCAVHILHYNTVITLQFKHI